MPTITYVLLLSNPMSVQVPFCIENSTQLMLHAKGWSFGYISAMNELLQFSLQSPIDEDGVWLAIMKHCEQNPMDDQYAATVSVWMPVIMKHDPNVMKQFLELHMGR